MKHLWLKLSLCICIVSLSSCARQAKVDPPKVLLQFSAQLDKEVYSASRYKKPPQMAIWIEQAPRGPIRTVWVTSKTGAADWGGNTTRPVSLPYWVSRWNIETGADTFPTVDNHLPDALTGATPAEQVAASIQVPAGTTWNCFVEVNTSGDFNDDFPPTDADGKRDTNGNGQPSIIYQARITATAGSRAVLKLVGRTDQYEAVSKINPDLKPITTAIGLLSDIEVACRAVNP